MAVITTRPFRTETPASTISPTAAETEKLIPVKMRVKIPPASPSGTVRKTAVARPADPRAMKSRTKMATKASGTTIDNRAVAACKFSKDRKSVVEGKSVSVRVAPGGRRIIKKKKPKTKH